MSKFVNKWLTVMQLLSDGVEAPNSWEINVNDRWADLKRTKVTSDAALFFKDHWHFFPSVTPPCGLNQVCVCKATNTHCLRYLGHHWFILKHVFRIQEQFRVQQPVGVWRWFHQGFCKQELLHICFVVLTVLLEMPPPWEEQPKSVLCRRAATNKNLTTKIT